MTTLPHDEIGSPEGLPEVGDRYEEHGRWVEVYARAELPTRYGRFDIFVFRTSTDDMEHVVLTRGQLDGATGVPVRLHSECDRRRACRRVALPAPGRARHRSRQ